MSEMPASVQQAIDIVEDECFLNDFSPVEKTKSRKILWRVGNIIRDRIKASAAARCSAESADRSYLSDRVFEGVRSVDAEDAERLKASYVASAVSGDAGDAATLRGFIKTYGMTPSMMAAECERWKRLATEPQTVLSEKEDELGLFDLGQSFLEDYERIISEGLVPGFVCAQSPVEILWHLINERDAALIAAQSQADSAPRELDTEAIHQAIYRRVYNAVKHILGEQHLTGTIWLATQQAAEDVVSLTRPQCEGK
jgi:hypothetical protein